MDSSKKGFDKDRNMERRDERLAKKALLRQADRKAKKKRKFFGAVDVEEFDDSDLVVDL